MGDTRYQGIRVRVVPSFRAFPELARAIGGRVKRQEHCGVDLHPVRGARVRVRAVLSFRAFPELGRQLHGFCSLAFLVPIF
uniref:Uncharacterized protein LOC104221791 isoform X3 n=1 Tax=Nicotiana sylvestris TaxID=4096 RepID=A0A1U7W997_NICSY|nr:PREDICTED: uncharacterized protein LOC104221791 isoform X3 [Nicotiana sylvestris]